jgi:hypothetical protein
LKLCRRAGYGLGLKAIKAMIQFVMKTGRFQPKTTVAEDIRVAEGAGVVVGVGVARKTENSDDEIVGRGL